MAKRRHVSDEDRALFRRSVGEVRRIPDDHPPPARTGKTRRDPERERRNPSNPRGPVEPGWARDVGPGDVLSFSRGGVPRRELVRLRRGQIEVEAELDLHGQTVEDAEGALDRFLGESRLRGRRCVLVIHGKGFGSRDGRPVMKTWVNRSLRGRPEVRAFCSATPPDGGTGALYVLLKRATPLRSGR